MVVLGAGGVVGRGVGIRDVSGDGGVWLIPAAFVGVMLFRVLGDPRALAHCRERVPLSPLEALGVRGALVGIIGCAVAGAVASAFPSMAFRSKSGVIMYSYALSSYVGLVLWAVVLVVAVAAWRQPSPRRLAAVAVAAIGAWPVLLAIRAINEPWFDLDDQFVMLSSAAIGTYVLCMAVATGLALYLATAATRIGMRPVTQVQLARATVVRTAAPR